MIVLGEQLIYLFLISPLTGEIDSESLIRDDEVLYCSTNGQFLGEYWVENNANAVFL